MQALRLSFGAAIAVVWLLGLAAEPAPRSHAARAAFQRAYPCPASGAPRGPCPGYVIDHIVPLCAGGEDRPENMQWQTRPDSLIKDRHEGRLCRLLKRPD